MTDNSYLTGGNRPFYLHFAFEHEGLDCAVHDLQDSLHNTEKPVTAEQVDQRLVQLRDLMTKHFHEEEEGCFDEICAQHPHMCRATRKMEGVHRKLMEQLDQLSTELHRRKSVTKSWKNDFDAFADAMKRHEDQEKDFVRRGLDLGDEDD